MSYKSYKSWIVTKARFFEVCHSFSGSPSREGASHIWLRFRQADDFTAFLPLTPLL
jgi:hypothetical protein